MRRFTTILAMSAAVLTVSASAAAPAMASSGSAQGPGNPQQTSYYLALGDSLSVGLQPVGPGGAYQTTTDGYTYQLYNSLHKQQPGLQLADLGCSGETTGTMISGGLCNYPPGHDGLQTGTTGLPVANPAGSQLQAATRFLRDHRGHVSLITIDIGANDLNSCIAGPPSDLATCASGVAQTVAGNLATIMTALRVAGGSQVRIIGMSYYDPELAYWLKGTTAYEQIAEGTVPLLESYNGVLAGVYRQFDARVADVFTAFHTADGTDQVTLPGVGQVPVNVATICELTWECTQFQNEHPNAEGYAVIAQAFLAADQP